MRRTAAAAGSVRARAGGGDRVRGSRSRHGGRSRPDGPAGGAALGAGPACGHLSADASGRFALNAGGAAFDRFSEMLKAPLPKAPPKKDYDIVELRPDKVRSPWSGAGALKSAGKVALMTLAHEVPDHMALPRRSQSGGRRERSAEPVRALDSGANRLRTSRTSGRHGRNPRYTSSSACRKDARGRAHVWPSPADDWERRLPGRGITG